MEGHDGSNGHVCSFMNLRSTGWVGGVRVVVVTFSCTFLVVGSWAVVRWEDDDGDHTHACVCGRWDGDGLWVMVGLTRVLTTLG